MGNIIKANPIGIDVHIQNIQSSLYNEFFPQYGVGWNSYGRIYRNETENGGYEPRPYAGNGDYILNNFFDDNSTGLITSFFDISESIKYLEGFATAKVCFYFFCSDITKLVIGFDRNDEAIMQPITTWMQLNYGFVLHSKRIGINTIMKDWVGEGSVSTKTQNQQPFFVFSIEFELNEYLIRYDNPNLLGFVQNPIPLIPYTRYNATGIDQWIEYLQIGIFNYLLTIFSGNFTGFSKITQSQYNQFGRCYRNFKINGKNKKEYIPEAFVKFASTGNFDYCEVLFNDSNGLAIQSFFDCGEAMREESTSGLAYVNVKAYFFVDLSQLYADQNERYDEEIIILVSNFLSDCYGFGLEKIVRGTKAVFDEYNGFKIKQNKKFNQQPQLAFRVDLKKYYDESWNNCPQLIPSGVGGNEFDPQEFDPNQFA